MTARLLVDPGERGRPDSTNERSNRASGFLQQCIVGGKKREEGRHRAEVAQLRELFQRFAPRVVAAQAGDEGSRLV
jgi:hypothetical protein